MVLGCVIAAIQNRVGLCELGRTGSQGVITMSPTVVKSEKEWQQTLTPEQFHIMREKGTEPAYSGEYWNCKRPGIYRCAGCGLELFDSESKYDSGTGWPSFTNPIKRENIGTEIDRKFLSTRTEVHCSRCGSHLGHVFPDGPQPTGLRYCLNSASLDLEEADINEEGL